MGCVHGKTPRRIDTTAPSNQPAAAVNRSVQQPASPASAQLPLPQLSDKRLAEQTYFSENEVHALGKLFAELSNSLHKDGLIHKDEFALALFKAQNQSNLFVEQVFDIFDTKRNDVIDFEEFVRALSIFHPNAPLNEKAAFAFRIYDLDCTGSIEPGEVKRFLLALLSDNPAIELSEGELQSIIDETFEEADILRDGKINPQEWQAFVQKNPSIINYMTLPVLRQLTDKYPSFRDIDMM